MERIVNIVLAVIVIGSVTLGIMQIRQDMESITLPGGIPEKEEEKEWCND